MAEANPDLGTVRGPRKIDETSTTCTLGREVAFTGNLQTNQELVVLGSIKGKLVAKSSLVIGREAQIDADIQSQRVLVHGRVNGNIRCSERIEIGPNGQVRGDLSAPVVQINEGAQFEGFIQRNGKGAGRPSFLRRFFR